MAIFSLVIMLFGLALIAFIGYMRPAWRTEVILETVVHSAKLSDAETLSPTPLDGWDMPISYQRIGSPKIVTYVATSAGRDKEFATEDDMEYSIHCQRMDR